MSDETPQADDTPIVPSTPAEPANPAAPASPAAPAAETPVTPAPVADPPTVETPAPAAPPAAAPAAPVAAAPPAAAPAAPAPEHRSGFFVPKWLAIVAGAIVAALVFGGVGYAIGDSNGGGSNSQRASSFPGIGRGNQNGGRTFPGNGPLGNGGTNGNNGSGGINGNGNGNNGGTGSGQTTNTAFLGVGVDPQSTGGATVTAVKSGSPADNAGLKTGDVITKVDDTSIGSSAALVQAVHSHSIGDQVTITYTRGGSSATATVTLGSNTTSQSS
jgi:membrane-associated protease RseP (regulator of RpoE activity)